MACLPKCTFRQSLYHAVKEAEADVKDCGRVKTQRGVVVPAVVFFHDRRRMF